MGFSILTFFTVTSIVSIVARALGGASVLFNTTSASIVAIHCGTGVCNIFIKVLKFLNRFDCVIPWFCVFCDVIQDAVPMPPHPVGPLMSYLPDGDVPVVAKMEK